MPPNEERRPGDEAPSYEQSNAGEQVDISTLALAASAIKPATSAARGVFAPTNHAERRLP